MFLPRPSKAHGARRALFRVNKHEATITNLCRRRIGTVAPQPIKIREYRLRPRPPVAFCIFRFIRHVLHLTTIHVWLWQVPRLGAS